MKFEKKLFLIISLLTLIFSIISQAKGDRLKDLVSFAGIRSNQLLGYGLVVGLDGTGDSASNLTLQSMASTVSQFGLKVGPADISAKNAAAVMVTAELRPFTKIGQTINVTVSSSNGNSDGSSFINKAQRLSSDYYWQANNSALYSSSQYSGNHTTKNGYWGSSSTTLADSTTYDGEWVDLSYSTNFNLKRIIINCEDPQLKAREIVILAYINNGWNLIGFPVDCLMLRAAPPRPSPSDLVKIIPVKLTVLLNSLATFAATCPVRESATNITSEGLIICSICLISLIICKSI